MKEKTRNYSFAFLVILSLITALGTFVYGMKNYHTDNISINQRQEITSLSEGWYYIEEGKKAEISSLPVKIKDSGRKSLTIYLDLSKPAAEDAVLCMENFHQAVEVFAGDRKLYSYGAGNKGPAGWILGNIWNIIDLPEGVHGTMEDPRNKIWKPQCSDADDQRKLYRNRCIRYSVWCAGFGFPSCFLSASLERTGL